MERLRSLGNLRAAVPRLAAMAALAVVVGIAAAGTTTIGAASAGDVRFTEQQANVSGNDSLSAPAKPRKLEAQRLDDGSVGLTWRKPRGSADIVGYKVTYSSPDLAEPVTETPITNDKGRVTGVVVSLVKYVGGDFRVKYRVRAYNDEVEGAESKQVRVARIGAPEELTRFDDGDDPYIRVCWSSASGGATRYEIMRRMDSEKASSMRVVATVAETFSEYGATWRQCYMDNWTAADTEYVYKVRGVQGNWKGKPSSSLRAMRTSQTSNEVDE